MTACSTMYAIDPGKKLNTIGFCFRIKVYRVEKDDKLSHKTFPKNFGSPQDSHLDEQGVLPTAFILYMIRFGGLRRNITIIVDERKLLARIKWELLDLIHCGKDSTTRRLV